MEFTPELYATFWSLIPPIIAITMALLTKEVYSSLFVGIVTGALLYSNGNLELAFNTITGNGSDAGIIPSLADRSHAAILIFVVLLAWITAVINQSGAARAFGKWAESHIKNKTLASLATMALGILIFIDDGFNCMTVGSVMKPVTDRHKVSREKLAYIIDSTAAPICIIAPISSWAAAVTYSVPEGSGINGFTMFLQTIPFNFYAIGTLVFMFMMIIMKTDYGPMRRYEQKANEGIKGKTDEKSAISVSAEDTLPAPIPDNGRVLDLVIPVFVLIITSIGFMLYTGGITEGASVVDAFSNCDSATAFVMSSIVTIIITLVYYLIRRIVPFKHFMGCLPMGFRTMTGPMTILVLAWTLSSITGLLGADVFIHDVIEASASELQMLMPLIIFLFSVFLSFSTGTSWGTFSILIPIVVGAFAGNDNMLAVSISACLAGAVCGDHCSPISDTTIMSSAGAGCVHINHVATQLPYALTVAGCAAVSYLVAGVLAFRAGGAVSYLSLPLMALILFAVIKVAARKSGAQKQVPFRNENK